MEMSPCMCLVDRRQTGNGAKCIYKNCKNKYYKVAGKGIRFFRVPKEDARCRQWLKACGRVDLIKETLRHPKRTRRIGFVQLILSSTCTTVQQK
ncbi:unnamed protein product [Acanthoscelides obtectus]|uniref:THAP-type domain-containing protein n=1 Tax=Acanthoscelides obtectus TaxID=200917 RepID=A0A9P0PP43_ACAOB|nr:unnamed protein product [Acanthoscelides obtectus]CAK1659184.1 hypothetical protein AOBTE_LOCUS21332 [Acanthoscelides obtectus]